MVSIMIIVIGAFLKCARLPQLSPPRANFWNPGRNSKSLLEPREFGRIIDAGDKVRSLSVSGVESRARTSIGGISLQQLRDRALNVEWYDKRWEKSEIELVHQRNYSSENGGWLPTLFRLESKFYGGFNFSPAGGST